MNELLTEQISHDDLKTYLKAFYKYAKKALNIERDPRIFFRKDQENADNFIGKTGYYDPEKEEIHLFITDRHAKDVVRSFAHELIHHLQKLTGVTDNIDMSITGEDAAYSLHDDLLRAMEVHAFKDGNLTFRDWTDKMKIGLITVISERKLKPSEKKKLIGLEKDVPEAPFTKKYGKKKGKQIYYATLTKQAKKKKKSKTIKEEKTMKLKVKRMEEEGKMEEALPSKMEPPKKMSKLDRVMRDLEGEREELQSAPGAGDIGGGSSMSSISDEAGKSGEAGGLAGFLNLSKLIDDKFSGMDEDQKVRFAAFLARKAKAASEETRKLRAQEKLGQEMADRAETVGTPSLTGKLPMEEEQLQESKKTPYPVLFEQRERLLKEAYQTREERVYAELVRRFIKK
jgi:hypothetical protein